MDRKVSGMVKKNSKRQPLSIGQRFMSLERPVRTAFRKRESGFRLVHLEFRSFRKEMNERFTRLEARMDRLITHVDRFMKRHEACTRPKIPFNNP